MPLIEVKLYDRRINDEVVPKVIEKMTDAICDVIGDDIRDHTWVLVEGLSPKQWGIGGKPTAVTQPARTAAEGAAAPTAPPPGPRSAAPGGCAREARGAQASP